MEVTMRTQPQFTALLTMGLLLLLSPAALADGNTSTMTVVHGIPDTPVDVYVNGELTLRDFQYETITDPLRLPAGSTTSTCSPPAPIPMPIPRSCQARLILRLAGTCQSWRTWAAVPT